MFRRCQVKAIFKSLDKSRRGRLSAAEFFALLGEDEGENRSEVATKRTKKPPLAPALSQLIAQPAPTAVRKEIQVSQNSPVASQKAPAAAPAVITEMLTDVKVTPVLLGYRRSV